MNTSFARKMTRPLALGAAVLTLGLSLATAAQAATRPPIQNRSFDIHTDSTHGYKPTLIINQVTGAAPTFNFTGTLQYAGKPQWPVVGQMIDQPQGGHKILFTASPSSTYSESFEGAIRMDRQGDGKSPLFMAGQYFVSQSVLQRRVVNGLVRAVPVTVVDGPRPFCATAPDLNIVIL
jgi:hypothetical protein